MSGVSEVLMAVKVGAPPGSLPPLYHTLTHSDPFFLPRHPPRSLCILSSSSSSSSSLSLSLSSSSSLSLSLLLSMVGRRGQGPEDVEEQPARRRVRPVPAHVRRGRQGAQDPGPARAAAGQDEPSLPPLLPPLPSPPCPLPAPRPPPLRTYRRYLTSSPPTQSSHGGGSLSRLSLSVSLCANRIASRRGGPKARRRRNAAPWP